MDVISNSRGYEGIPQAFLAVSCNDFQEYDFLQFTKAPRDPPLRLQ